MKKKLKGMTLMEVIVSLFIYALLGLLLMEIMSVVNATMRSTNQLNERLSFEAKFADNQIVTAATRLTATDQNGQPVPKTATVSYGATGFIEANAAGSIAPTNYNEWEARYTNPNLNGTIDYAEDINFRFITYTTNAVNDQFPGYDFRMNLMVVPFLNRDGLTDAEKTQAQRDAFTFMQSITRVEVTAQDANGNSRLIDENALVGIDPLAQTPVYWSTPSRTLAPLPGLTMNDVVNMAVGTFDPNGTNTWNPNGTQPLTFSIENLTDQHTETRMQVSNNINNNAESNGNGYNVVINFIDDNTMHPTANTPLVRLSVEIPTVYMYVLRGTTESYYQHSMAIIDLNIAADTRTMTPQQRSRGIIVCRSNSTGNFDLSEYDQ